jgi:hypothetical protein
MYRAAFVAAAVLLAGCYRIPGSIRAYAAELPARADGQYAVLDEPLQKQLVMKDALLQCRIDREDGKSEAESMACRCATSASASWLDDCGGWLGEHTPRPVPTGAPSAAPGPKPDPVPDAAPGEP